MKIKGQKITPYGYGGGEGVEPRNEDVLQCNWFSEYSLSNLFSDGLKWYHNFWEC